MDNIKQTDFKSGRWLTWLQRCHGDQVQSSSSGAFGKGRSGGDEMRGHQNQSELFITAEGVKDEKS